MQKSLSSWVQLTKRIKEVIEGQRQYMKTSLGCIDGQRCILMSNVTMKYAKNINCIQNIGTVKY
jgi:hypothetical protein